MISGDTSATKSDCPERDRAVAIFRYLRDLAQLKLAVVRDLKSYEGVFWLETVRGKQGCTTRCFRPDPNVPPLELDDDDAWLTVRKLPEPTRPDFPVILARWIAPETGRAPDSPPRLLDRIRCEPPLGKATKKTLPNQNNPDGETAQPLAEVAAWRVVDEYELLEEHPEVAVALNDYVEGSWKPWATKYTAWTEFQENVYSPLFAIHRDIKRLGEEFELVLGLGCLTWRTTSGHHVKRHLITAQAMLEFDPAGGVFALRPGADGAKLSLEVDMLDASEQPTVAQMDVVRSDLAKAEDDPWDFDAIDRSLRGFVQAIKEDGTYYPGAYSAKQVERLPQAAFAPALLLRRRNSRGLLVAFETIIAQLQNGADIPPAVRRLTGTATGSGDSVEHPRGTAGDGGPNQRVYFPLAANEDQRQIVERLNGKHGVLVQGPPGTGKSHTIANLICHLLATSQRVLITAQTPRALEVLRQKLPVEIRPLCLSVLGNDKAAQDNVEDSVRNITDKADASNALATSGEIDKAERELDRLLAREAQLERELRVFREAEIHEHTVAEGAYRGTAQAIARQVRREQSRFAWLTDAADPAAQAPIDAEGLRTYRDGFTAFSEERTAELEKRRPTRGTDIPSGDRLLALVRDFHAFRDKVRPVADGEVHLGTLPLDELKTTCAALRALQAGVQQLPVSAAPWASIALNDVLRGATASWDLLLSQTNNAVDSLRDVAHRLEDADIRVPAGARSDLLLADVSDLLAHLQRGGRLGFWIFRPSVVRRTLRSCREVTVDGRPCQNVSTLGTAKEHLECTASIGRAWKLWEGRATPTGKSLVLQVGAIGELSGILSKLLAVRPLADAASCGLARLHLPSVPALDDSRALDDFASRCERVIARREFDVVNSQLDARVQALREVANYPDAHPVCARLATALDQRDERGVSIATEELTRLEADAGRLQAWRQLRDSVTTRLPNLARAIAESATDAVWTGRFADWKAAWRWAQADDWLAKYVDPRKAAAVESELRQVKEKTTACLIRLSADRAWYSCLGAMSPAHQQHLNAWRQAIKKIGKGTGKHAGHWRRVAQGELEQCRDAIPAWVMPLYRVFESVRPAPGIFDVVIVDEASQCGPESLILFYLAKKVIVVGDDKQISPSNVGVDKDQAKSLLRQHLDGIELADTFDVDSSLFDHGQVRLGKRITLHEHFRCMPEIIRFSNDLCYKGALIPLRQYPPKRLAPFVARYVADGKREGSSQSSRNVAEAEALANTIAACCADPMYDGRTMGVISLLGETQAKYIERLLLRLIGAEEIERRRIVCGDAYSFQGDERHVIFLSLVIASRDRSETGFSALVGDRYVQRFNVAASRAQDQLWLFHSAMPEDIGNHECMRHRLLTYFYDPARHAAESIGIDIDRLRHDAESAERPETPPPPFDSWFEVDVYLRIVARGYRVLPQYRAGRHRIDLVVEGSTRLAIECDGDFWHGPDRFDEDMARKRQLERANWRFLHIRGSVFERDPDAALLPLWSELAELGIEPMLAIDGFGSGDGYVPQVPATEPSLEPTNVGG